jgi:large subunit ribosomal protein L5
MPIELLRLLCVEKECMSFLDRLITSSLPRVEISVGLKLQVSMEEEIITLVLRANHFPEIDIDKVNKISGMDITFVTTAKTDKTKSLLTELGLPLKKN